MILLTGQPNSPKSEYLKQEVCIGPESLVTAKLAFFLTQSSKIVNEFVASIPTFDANRLQGNVVCPPIHTIPKPLLSSDKLIFQSILPFLRTRST